MSVDALKQILNDKSLADNFVVTLANGQTYQLGDLRSLSAADQTALSQREAKVAEAQANIAKQQDKLAKDMETLRLAQTETARLFAEVNEKRGTQHQNDNQPDPLEALERDPVVGPLAKTLRQLAAQQAAFTKDVITPIVNAQKQMAQAYVDDRVADIYERIVPAGKRTEITLDALVADAQSQRLFTRSGIPDIAKVYQNRTTQPLSADDLAAKLKEAKEAGAREALEAARADNTIRTPRPGFNPTGGRAAGSEGFKPVIRDNTTVGGALQQAIDAAAKDADIWANVDGGRVS